MLGPLIATDAANVDTACEVQDICQKLALTRKFMGIIHPRFERLLFLLVSRLQAKTMD